jgi:hypothetical protein
MQRSRSIPSLRIHIRTSSDMLFDDFNFPILSPEAVSISVNFLGAQLHGLTQFNMFFNWCMNPKRDWIKRNPCDGLSFHVEPKEVHSGLQKRPAKSRSHWRE